MIEKNYIHSKNAYYALFMGSLGLSFAFAALTVTIGSFWVGLLLLIPYLLFSLLMIESYHAWRVKGGRWKYD